MTDQTSRRVHARVTHHAGRRGAALLAALLVLIASGVAWAAFRDSASVSARTTVTAEAQLACRVEGAPGVWTVAAVRNAPGDWTSTFSRFDPDDGTFAPLATVDLPHPVTSLSYDEDARVLYAIDGHDGQVYTVDSLGLVSAVGTSAAGLGEWSGTWTSAGVVTVDRAKDLLVVHDPADGSLVAGPVRLTERPLDGDLAEVGSTLYGVVSAPGGDRVATVPTSGTVDAAGDEVASPTLLTPAGSALDVTSLWAADGALYALAHDGSDLNAYQVDTTTGGFTLLHAAVSTDPVLDAASCTA